jgi:SAM-dependent methyltransferase
MHTQARDFTLFVKNQFPEYFENIKALDVGSGDINGNNKFLFKDCEYHGNDVIEAPNVTIVSRTKDLTFDPETFDTIISTECFEHDPDFKESLKKILYILKPNGLFLFTCASTGRREHGTSRTSPNDSYGTLGNIGDMIDYYKNISHNDLKNTLDLDAIFSVWDTYYNSETYDLYFVGIKNGNSLKELQLQEYVSAYVSKTTYEK